MKWRRNFILKVIGQEKRSIDNYHEMLFELEAWDEVEHVRHLLVHDPLLVAGRTFTGEEVLPQGLKLPAHHRLVFVADPVVADSQLLALREYRAQFKLFDTHNFSK